MPLHKKLLFQVLIKESVLKFGNNSTADSGIHFESFSTIKNVTLSNVTVIGASQVVTSDRTRDLIHVDDDVKFYASHSCVRNASDETWKCSNPFVMLRPSSSATKITVDAILMIFTLRAIHVTGFSS